MTRRLGWCITLGHHAECPRVVGEHECSCPCHEGQGRCECGENCDPVPTDCCNLQPECQTITGHNYSVSDDMVRVCADGYGCAARVGR